MLIVMIKLDHLDRLRLERGVEHLHRLGPRATAEFLTEVADHIGGMPAIIGTLLEYERRLSPDLLRVVGGDRFPRRPLRVMSQ
jgi:dihydroxyacid dehydratase/phosphogluconate dehydratase